MEARGSWALPAVHSRAMPWPWRALPNSMTSGLGGLMCRGRIQTMRYEGSQVHRVFDFDDGRTTFADTPDVVWP